MYGFVKMFHSGWAYLVLLFLFLTVVNSVWGFAKKAEFAKKDRTIALLGLIVTHTQLLVGLILYFVSPYGKEALGQMSNAQLRLTSMEHPLINIVAIVLITIGWSKHKRIEDSHSKFRTFSVFYGLGLILILSRIPWNLW